MELLSNFTDPAWRAAVIEKTMSFSPAWTPESIMIAVIAFTFIVFFWDTYLAYRQVCIMINGFYKINKMFDFVMQHLTSQSLFPSLSLTYCLYFAMVAFRK